MSKTDSRTAASWTASEHEVVVLPRCQTHMSRGKRPTYQHHLYHLKVSRYPYQRLNCSPQKIHFKLFWSSTFWSVGGRGSKSSDIVLIDDTILHCIVSNGQLENGLERRRVNILHVTAEHHECIRNTTPRPTSEDERHWLQAI